jgi:hypothetical protein
MLTPALVALALCASPESAAAPRIAVWIQPAGTLYAAEESVRLGRGVFYLPLGATLALPRLPIELAAELTLTAGSEILPNASRGFFGGLLSVGPAFRLSSQPFSGFFIQPKVIASFVSQSATVPLSYPYFGSGSMGEIGLGIDVGYELRFGWLYLAPVVGANISLASGQGAPLSSLYAFRPLFAGIDPEQTAAIVYWGVNLNLLRIGGAF